MPDWQFRVLASFCCKQIHSAGSMSLRGPVDGVSHVSLSADYLLSIILTDSVFRMHAPIGAYFSKVHHWRKIRITDWP